MWLTDVTTGAPRVLTVASDSPLSCPVSAAAVGGTPGWSVATPSFAGLPAGATFTHGAPWVPCGQHVYFTFVSGGVRSLARVNVSSASTFTLSGPNAVTVMTGYDLPSDLANVSMACLPGVKQLMLGGGGGEVLLASEGTAALVQRATDRSLGIVNPRFITAMDPAGGGFCALSDGGNLACETNGVEKLVGQESDNPVPAVAAHMAYAKPQKRYDPPNPEAAKSKAVFRCSGCGDSCRPVRDLCVATMEPNDGYRQDVFTIPADAAAVGIPYGGFQMMYHPSTQARYVLFGAEANTGDGVGLWALEL